MASTASGTFDVTMSPAPAELDGITGTLHLTVEDDGTHRYELAYQL